MNLRRWTASVAVTIGLCTSTHAWQIRPAASVICNGTICGGDGPSDYSYEIKPHGSSVSSFELGVEDGDVGHYVATTYPSGWSMSIVSKPHAHDVAPTEHGRQTEKLGSCPYVLRFSGPALSVNFTVGYSYYLETQGYHDVSHRVASSHFQWVLSNPAMGPLHSPLRPNVLIITLDDVGTDQLATYDSLFEDLDATPNSPTANTLTPRLDLLAEQGIVFTNFYANPLCSASRASLQTGRHPFRTGVGSILRTGPACRDQTLPSCPFPMENLCPGAPCNSPPPCALEQTCCFKMRDQIYLSELLKQGYAAQNDGYRCAAFGKWHLSYQNPDGDMTPGLDSHAVDNGNDRFYGFMANPDMNASPPEDHYYWRKIEHDQGFDPVAFPSGPPATYADEQWCATVTRGNAVEWINAQSDPFLAYVCFSPPHVPTQVPPLALLSPETRAVLEALDPLPPQTPPVRGDQGHIVEMETADGQLYYQAMLEAVDTEIGNLLDQIEPEKLRRTMIFIVSDNGTPVPLVEAPHDPLHGKSTVYQLGVRVPLLVAGPLVSEAGSLCDELVGSVDLWRTIAELTGADESLASSGTGLPVPEDSLSFADVIRDPSAAGPRQAAFSQRFLQNGRTIECLKEHARAMSNKDFRYLRIQGCKGSLPNCADCDRPECDSSWVRSYTERFFRVTDLNEVDDLLPLAPEDPEYADYIALQAAMDALGFN